MKTQTKTPFNLTKNKPVSTGDVTRLLNATKSNAAKPVTDNKFGKFIGQ